MSKELIDRNRDDVQWVLSTEQGRRFMWRLLTYCGVYQDMGGMQEEVYKQIGKRNVGLHIMSLVSDASEDRLFEMMKEAKNRNMEEIEHERRQSNETTRSIDTASGLSTEGLSSFDTTTGHVF